MMAAVRLDPPTAPGAAQLVVLLGSDRASAAPLASSAELLDSLCALAAGVATLDAPSYEASPVALLATVHQIRCAVERAAELLLALDRLHEQPTAGEELEAVDVRQTRSATPSVGDMCFAGTLELNRALRELSHARDEVELLVAAETACRKLRRAMQAVLAAARAAGSVRHARDEQQRHLESTDLLSALAVRKLYARFRRSLRRPSDDSPAAVLTAIRYAAGALAMLAGSPEYASARLSDRALLRRLRDRLLDWARGDQSSREGLQLLDDVWTCADLLRGLNRRQELRAHDALLLRSLLQGPGDDRRAWLRSCEGLRGLDDELDMLLERALTTAAAEHDLEHVLARLDRLQ